MLAAANMFCFCGGAGASGGDWEPSARLGALWFLFRQAGGFEKGGFAGCLCLSSSVWTAAAHTRLALPLFAAFKMNLLY